MSCYCLHQPLLWKRDYIFAATEFGVSVYFGQQIWAFSSVSLFNLSCCILDQLTILPAVGVAAVPVNVGHVEQQNYHTKCCNFLEQITTISIISQHWCLCQNPPVPCPTFSYLSLTRNSQGIYVYINSQSVTWLFPQHCYKCI